MWFRCCACVLIDIFTYRCISPIAQDDKIYVICGIVCSLHPWFALKNVWSERLFWTNICSSIIKAAGDDWSWNMWVKRSVITTAIAVDGSACMCGEVVGLSWPLVRVANGGLNGLKFNSEGYEKLHVDLGVQPRRKYTCRKGAHVSLHTHTHTRATTRLCLSVFAYAALLWPNCDVPITLRYQYTYT